MQKPKHNEIKRVLEKKTILLQNVIYRYDAEQEIKMINRKNDGYITIGTKSKENKWSQWHLEQEELISNLDKIISLKDIYISINNMYKCKRRLKYIRHLNAFWVDLDFYKTKYKEKTTEEIIQILRKKGLFEIEPSFFIDSGHGMYIFWLIQSATIGALPIWQKIQEAFNEKFLEFGADKMSIDAVHVLRLAGTVNTKTGKRSRLIYNSNRLFRFEQEKEDIRIYTIEELSKKILPALPYSKPEWEKLKKDKQKKKKESRKAKEKRKVVSLFNLYTLNYARLLDIEKIIELRKGNCKHCREFLCFLYRYYSCCYLKNKEVALKSVLELNNNFTEPLSEEEVINATKSAENAYELWEKTFKKYLELEQKVNIIKFFHDAGCYIYSNQKLIGKLNITEEEMVQGELKTLINTKIKNDRSKDYRNEWIKKYQKKKRRNSNGLTCKEQQKQDKIQLIIKLMNKGLKQKQIAEELGCSKSLVSTYVKEIKEKNIKDNEVTDVELIIC